MTFPTSFKFIYLLPSPVRKASLEVVQPSVDGAQMCLLPQLRLFIPRSFQVVLIIVSICEMMRSTVVCDCCLKLKQQKAIILFHKPVLDLHRFVNKTFGKTRIALDRTLFHDLT